MELNESIVFSKPNGKRVGFEPGVLCELIICIMQDIKWLFQGWSPISLRLYMMVAFNLALTPCLPLVSFASFLLAVCIILK